MSSIANEVALFTNIMFSSIAPCLSNSAKIASNSAKSVAALTPVTPEVILPLDSIAANKPSVPTASVHGSSSE
jgi:hypothetical protein